MARKIYYKIIDDGKNAVSDKEWADILRLQNWYNSEFVWTAGRLAFKMFAIFPNLTQLNGNADELREVIKKRRTELEQEGLSENETVEHLHAEGFIIVQKGGYFDKCIASGFTRIASNEFNAYLVCEFLLKVSLIANNATISCYDEGEFIKSKHIKFQQGRVIIPMSDESKLWYYKGIVNNRRAFAVVDPAKYDNLREFKTTIDGFNELSLDERMSIIHDWNWLGFENNFDLNGDDIQGFDLNKKVVQFILEKSE